MKSSQLVIVCMQYDEGNTNINNDILNGACTWLIFIFRICVCFGFFRYFVIEIDIMPLFSQHQMKIEMRK